jgi:hypothetical protein
MGRAFSRPSETFPVFAGTAAAVVAKQRELFPFKSTAEARNRKELVVAKKKGGRLRLP